MAEKKAVAVEAEVVKADIVRVPDNEHAERPEKPLALVPQAPKERYQGASLLRLKKSEAKALDEAFEDGDHDILPTGEVYVSQVHVRRRLNRALGPGQWALIPAGDYVKGDKKNVLFREYNIYVRGHFIGSTVGEAEYYEDNARMSWATAAEVVKSNALTRACKDLGIASECWDRHWTEAWKKKWAVKVFIKGKNDDKAKVSWRRKDSDPLAYEVGLVKTKEQYDAGERDEKPRPATTGAAPKPTPAATASEPGETREYVSLDQVTLLVDAAAEAGVARVVMEKIVMSEAGVGDLERIPRSKYDMIMKVIRSMKKAAR